MARSYINYRKKEFAGTVPTDVLIAQFKAEGGKVTVSKNNRKVIIKSTANSFTAEYKSR